MPLPRPTLDVSYFAVQLHLRNVASHRSPALSLSLIIVAAPTHVVAAIPLKPTSRIFLVDPPFLTPNRERLRRQDPKTIQRGIMPLAAEFRIAQPLGGKLSSAVGRVLTTEDTKRKHLLGRELRPKFATSASPRRQRVFVARLHEIGDDDSTRFHCSTRFTSSRPARGGDELIGLRISSVAGERSTRPPSSRSPLEMYSDQASPIVLVVDFRRVKRKAVQIAPENVLPTAICAIYIFCVSYPQQPHTFSI